MYDSKTLSNMFESYLPYIGDQIKTGTIIGPGKEVKRDKVTGEVVWVPFAKGYDRPDYSKFMEGREYQSEADCASMLFGLPSINSLSCSCCMEVFGCEIPEWSLNNDSHQIEETIHQNSKIKHSQSFPPGYDFKEDPLSLLETPPEVMSKINRLMEVSVVHSYHLLKAMLNLRNTMRMGVSLGEIKTDKNPENYQTPISHKPGYLFFSDVYYNRSHFLKWMKEQGFPIPDELKFAEKEDGTLYWLENRDKSKEVPNDPTEETNALINFVTEFCKNENEKIGQFPTKSTVQNHLENHLKSKRIKIGKFATLPEVEFRKIWVAIPENCKRPRGVTSIK